MIALVHHRLDRLTVAPSGGVVQGCVSMLVGRVFVTWLRLVEQQGLHTLQRERVWVCGGRGREREGERESERETVGGREREGEGEREGGRVREERKRER